MLKALTLYKRLLGASLLMIAILVAVYANRVEAQSFESKKCCKHFKSTRPDGGDCYGKRDEPCIEGKACPFNKRIVTNFTNAQCLPDQTAETGCLINAPVMRMVAQWSLQCPAVGIDGCTCEILQVGNINTQVLECNIAGDICPPG
ncbi:MAG: hypothetical protein K2W96_25045 [Gemmataceae bacterium]|nr:hypothetical protein [Gemmataceae bacterium]